MKFALFKKNTVIKSNKALLFATWLFYCLISALTIPSALVADMNDDPLLTKLQINQLEARNTEAHDSLTWDIDLWVGKDLHKFWIKSEGERAGGETKNAELQMLYSRAVTPFWDFQIGWRKDWRPKPQRNHLVLGFEGLAPYFLEVDTALFIGEGNQLSFRIDIDRELLLTQKIILEPEIELNFHSRNDPSIGIGSGLSDIEIGLRLHYGINRQFSPYVGVSWEKKLDNTAKYARAEGENTDNTQWLIGVSAWL